MRQSFEAKVARTWAADEEKGVLGNLWDSTLAKKLFRCNRIEEGLMHLSMLSRGEGGGGGRGWGF